MPLPSLPSDGVSIVLSGLYCVAYTVDNPKVNAYLMMLGCFWRKSKWGASLQWVPKCFLMHHTDVRRNAALIQELHAEQNSLNGLNKDINWYFGSCCPRNKADKKCTTRVPDHTPLCFYDISVQMPSNPGAFSLPKFPDGLQIWPVFHHLICWNGTASHTFETHQTDSCHDNRGLKEKTYCIPSHKT